MPRLPNSLRTPGHVGDEVRRHSAQSHGVWITVLKIILYLTGYSLSLWHSHEWVMRRIGVPSAYGYEFFVVIVFLIAALIVYPVCASILFITTKSILKWDVSLWSYGVSILLAVLVTPYAVFSMFWVISLLRAR